MPDSPPSQARRILDWINAARKFKVSSLYTRDAPVTSAREVIGWWEVRRVPYNLMVGSAGILSGIVIGVVAMGAYFLFGADDSFPDTFSLFLIPIYAVVANICYTGGWVVELLIRTVWKRESDRFAIASFSTGVVFSVLLTLLPGILFGIAGVFGLLGHLFGLVHKQGT